MPTKRILFYATNNDILEVIKKIESEMQVIYFKAGLINIEEVKELRTLIGEVNSEALKFGDCNLCTRYLILNSGTGVITRRVLQNSGEEKFAVDQKLNEFSVVFRPCGIYKEGSAIIEGELSTLHTNKTSVELFNNIANTIKNTFSKRNGCFLGNEAIILYGEGWRLAQNIKSPKEYDFQID